MNDMNYKGVIFDLDGVLCSTDEYHYRAWKKLADRLGIYFDRAINNRLRGVSRMESLEIVLERSDKHYTQEEKNRLADEKNETYKSFLASMSPSDVTDDVRETLTELKKRGVRIAIGSSSKNTKTILTRIGLLDEFDAISDGNNITKSKPDPEVFLKAAEYLSLPPHACLVVEDAESGIAAAKGGGFDAAGIGAAASSPRRDYAITHLSDLLQIVK